MIRLFTTMYAETDEKRRSEYRKCFEFNSACKFIDEICVLSEGGEELLPQNEKIHLRRVSQRPTYQQYFDWIMESAAGSDITIIANSDIHFEPSLKCLGDHLKPDQAAALTRWDAGSDRKPVLFNRNDSQDAWVFRGPLKLMQGDFCVGLPRCDNRMLYELRRAGYEVINPAFSVRSYHLHEGVRGEYRSENLLHFVDPPYAYLWPHNLWSLPRTLWHNFRHPDVKVGWRLDRRKISSSLPFRAVRKVLRCFKLPVGSAT